MLTEKEAWLKIGKAFGTHERSDLTSKGICAAVELLLDRGDVSYRTWDVIDDKTMDAVPGNQLYIAPVRTSEGDAIRAKFCREQAALLEKDGENGC